MCYILVKAGIGDYQLIIKCTSTKGHPKNRVIFWRVGSLYYRLPPLGECSRNPLAGVEEGCVWLQEFFWRLNVFAHFMMGDLRVHLPSPHWVFSSFWPKPAWPLFPTLPCHLILPWATVFCFPSKKSPQRKSFANVEEVKQKMAEVLKATKLTSSKTVLSSGKNILIGALHRMESALKVSAV